MSAGDPLLSSAPAARTSAQAVWSLVLGILSITCLWLLGSIPAILLGMAAMRTIDRSGGALKGRGLGLAGIVTGAVGVFAGLGTVAVATAILLPAFTGVGERAKQEREMNDLKQIVLACRMFAADHEGAYPQNLAELEPDYLEPGFLERVEEARGASLFRPGLSDSTPGEEPLVAGPAPIRHRRSYASVSGQVRSIPEAEFQAKVAPLFP